MSEVITADSASNSIEVLIRDPTTMQPLTGLTHSTSGLKFTISRDKTAPSAITLATQTVTGAYTSGGFVEKDSTLAPGVYRLDIPDAAVASGTGIRKVRIVWSGGGTLADGVDIDIVGFNPDIVDKDGYTMSSTGVNAVRDSILTDATRFSGAAIGTMATTIAALVAATATAVWSAATRTLSAIADSAGVTHLLAQYTDARAAKLDNLDAAVSTAAPSAVSAYIDIHSTQLAAIVTALGTALTDLGALHNLDSAAVITAVGTALTTAGIPAATLAALIGNTTPLAVEVKKVAGHTIGGAGTLVAPFGPVD